LKSANQNEEELNKKLKDLQGKRDEIVKELEDLLVKQHEAEAVRDDCNLKISLIENSKSTGSERHDEINSDIVKYREELGELTNKAESISLILSKYENSLNDFEKSVSDKNASIDEKTETYEKLKEEMDTLKSSSLALAERIKALRNMEELFEGYQKSVSYIMNAYKNNEINNVGKIYGPISTLLNVSSEYVTAIETALGTGLQHIVVDNETTAKSCIYALKNNKMGRATFYPITSVSSQSQTAEMQNAKKRRGYVGIANELITFDSKFANIFSSLLGRTVIFDNIENATEAAKSQNYRIKIVTLDGQQINVGGSFTGGSVRHDGTMLSRNSNIKSMESEKEDADNRILQIKASGQKLAEELRDLVSQRNADKQQYDLTDTLYRTEKTEYETLVAQINVKKELIEGLILDTKKISDENEKNIAELENYRTNFANAKNEIEAISQQRLDLDVKRYEFEDEIENVSGEINRNLIKIAEIKKDIESSVMSLEDAQNRLREIEQDIVSMNAKMEYLEEQVSSSAEKTAENRALYDAAVKRLENLENERAKLSNTESEFEKKRNDLNNKKRDVIAKREMMVRSHTMSKGKYEQLSADFEKMVNKLYEDYGLTYTTAVELGYPEVNEKNRKEILAVANECKQKIRNLGSINPNAIEEYKEVKERYDYLNTQITDLNNSKNDLLKIISDLETEMKKSFVDAFNAINENFNQVFKELFGGGHAELSLTDENDVLNCGIEIKAAPPGKVIKSLMLLSGGEQAFVAIALLFAILKVNPTPFCIFDEIEAALDDVNVARFGQYLKKYSDQTQFIVITHRRGTMEIADRLYGVTMPQKGISKVLTMDVNDVGKDRILAQNNNSN
jgi:chromosome segregation protein